MGAGLATQHRQRESFDNAGEAAGDAKRFCAGALGARTRRLFERDPLWQGTQPTRVGTATASDGTGLRYQVFDSPHAGRNLAENPLQSAGTPIVFANGIGVRFPGLAMQVSHLRDHEHSVVTWDYRGVGDSVLPRRDVDLSVGAHAADLLTVVDALGLDRFVLIGWSMGVQVGLEVIRRRPEAVVGFASLFGAPNPPFRNAFQHRIATGVESLVRALQRFPYAMTALTRLGTVTPEVTLPVLSAIRFASPRAYPPLLLSNVCDVSHTAPRAYLGSLRGLSEYDGWDVLPSVRCPSLVIAGGRDALAPPPVALEMADAMPDCERLVLDDASHFGLIEDPEDVNLAIDRLVDRVGRNDENDRAGRSSKMARVGRADKIDSVEAQASSRRVPTDSEIPSSDNTVSERPR